MGDDPPPLVRDRPHPLGPDTPRRAPLPGQPLRTVRRPQRTHPHPSKAPSDLSRENSPVRNSLPHNHFQTFFRVVKKSVDTRRAPVLLLTSVGGTDAPDPPRRPTDG